MTVRAPFIAIIDKDQGVRRAVVRLLRAHGFRAQGFASAEAFLLRGRTDDPACLVLDMELDGMSAIELLRRLAADGSSMPAVVMSAADDESTRGRALAAGCASYLSKPCSAELLLAAIGEATRAVLSDPRPTGRANS